jgi:hypothetical protein
MKFFQAQKNKTGFALRQLRCLEATLKKPSTPSLRIRDMPGRTVSPQGQQMQPRRLLISQQRVQQPIHRTIILPRPTTQQQQQAQQSSLRISNVYSGPRAVTAMNNTNNYQVNQSQPLLVYRDRECILTFVNYFHAF